MYSCLEGGEVFHAFFPHVLLQTRLPSQTTPMFVASPLFLSQQSWSAFIPGAAGHPHSAPREAMLGWSMGESRARAAPTLHICNVLQLPLHRASKGGREEEKQENNSGYLPQTLQLERGRES